MSQAGTEREPDAGAHRAELTEVVAELRSELQSIREREVRRESRLVAFDEQLAHMESSLLEEVGRLRSTGSAVDLITEHLRIAVRELLTEREQTAGDLDELRAHITALGAPDLQPVLTQLDQVSSRLAALPGRELRPLADQLEQLRQQVASLPDLDLTPVTQQLEALRAEVEGGAPLAIKLGPVLYRIDGLATQIEAITAPDLTSLEQRLDSLGQVDLKPLAAEIAVLRDLVTAVPPPDLTGIEERIAALPLPPEVDLQPVQEQLGTLQRTLAEGLASLPSAPEIDLAPLQEQLTTLHHAVTDGLANLPAAPDDAELREDLSRLNAQIDALRTALADRFDAIPAPDLEPVTAELTALAERVGAIPAPDLGSIEARLARLDERLAALPKIEALTAAMTGPIDALRDGDRTDEVLRALTDAAGGLRETIDALPDPATSTDAVVGPLRTDIEALTSASAEVRRDLALVTDVLAGLTQLAERSDERLTGLGDLQRSAMAEQRTATAEAVAALARALGGQVQQVESQVVQLVARTAALDDIQQGLGRTREAVEGLTTRTDRAEEVGRRNADDQALALARVTAATDALASTVGTVRAAIGTMVDEGRDATVETIDQRIGARLDESSASVEARLTSHVDAALTALGITQLRQSVAEVATQVVESRADARAINESIAAFDERVAQTAAAALTPVTTALGRLRQEIEAIPAPDLGPVAAQLARLSATIVSQTRSETASPQDIDALRTSLQETLDALGQQLEAQGATTTAVAEDLSALAAVQPYHALLADEQRQALTDQIAQHLIQSDTALQAGLERISVELAATREAAERRSGSRWRRGGGDDQPAPTPTVASGASELEQRIDQALQELDHRLSTLGQLIERAGAFADDAAQAAAATLRVVSAPPPPRPAPTPRAPRKTAAKKAAKRATTAKKAATKKTTAKKASPAAKRAPVKKARPVEGGGSASPTA